MIEYEAVIGLEVHVQLLTKSKMYCSCSAVYASEPPNTLVCPVCLGLPGALPAINRQAVEFTMMTGLALNCGISESTRFDRKNYYYPDMMKNYQISQYDMPICTVGWMEIDTPDGPRRTGIHRVHLEEDVARLTHRVDPTGRAYSLVDINRAGVPLMEIVGEPDLRTPEEARQYLMKLRTILQYLGVSTGSMEEGSFRCDANVSVRPVGTTELGTKVEVKNMNSFRGVFRAMEYEIERQVRVLREGERIVQETRGWNDEQGVTVAQRSKEFAHDYRYFPEPDLPPLALAREWVEEVRSRLVELPDARRERFAAHHGLTLYEAQLLTGSKQTADYFEAVLASYPKPKVVANWVTGELFRLLNATGTDISRALVGPGDLGDLLKMVEQGGINLGTAKEVLEEMFKTGRNATEIVSRRGLSQISDADALSHVVDEVLAANPQVVADYRAGKKQAQGFLVGQVMRATKGKANPGLVNKLLAERLDGSDPS